MPKKMNDAIARCEQTREAALSSDPFICLRNFSRPSIQDADDETLFLPSAICELSDILRLFRDERPQSDQTMRTAIKRELCLLFGREAMIGIELFATSDVKFRTVLDIYSTWTKRLYKLIDDADAAPYHALEQIGNELATELADVCRPSRFEIAQYIADHKPDDILDDVIEWLHCEEDEYEAIIDPGIDIGATELTISAENVPIPLFLPFARSIVNDLRQVDARCRDFATSKYLTLYNGTWREPGDPVKDASGFSSTIRLSSIHIHSPSHCEFWYDDGGLFHDHSIRVDVDRAGQPTGSGLEG